MLYDYIGKQQKLKVPKEDLEGVDVSRRCMRKQYAAVCVVLITYQGVAPRSRISRQARACGASLLEKTFPSGRRMAETLSIILAAAMEQCPCREPLVSHAVVPPEHHALLKCTNTAP